jgi:Cu/Ag efflux protein CusF
MRTALKRALVATLLLATAGCATLGDSGTVTGTIDKVDAETRTITVAGKLLQVPEERNFAEIEQGTKYKVSYEREGDHFVLTQLELKR